MIRNLLVISSLCIGTQFIFVKRLLSKRFTKMNYELSTKLDIKPILIVCDHRAKLDGHTQSGWNLSLNFVCAFSFSAKST